MGHGCTQKIGGCGNCRRARVASSLNSDGTPHENALWRIFPGIESGYGEAMEAILDRSGYGWEVRWTKSERVFVAEALNV
jgi:protein gp37